MANSCAPLAAIVLAACLLVFSPVARAALPDYQVGDIATEDVITPISLSVANPGDTETLRQSAAKDSPYVLRFNAKGPDEAEVALRAAIIMARYKFMRIFQEHLRGHIPTEADIGSPAFTRAVAEVSRDTAKDFPFEQLTALWVNGASEETFVLTLAQPLRQAMAQIVVDPATETLLPLNQPLRLVTVKNLGMPLGPRSIEGPGLIISQSKVISLLLARQLVENNFVKGQHALGRFTASFVRANAQFDPSTTELLRDRAIQSVAATDNYPAAQLIVRKGQIIDRKTLNALATLRAQTAVELPPARPELPRPLPTPAELLGSQDPDTVVRIAVVSGSSVFLASLGFFWFRRIRRSTTRRRSRPRRRRDDETLAVMDERERLPRENRAWLAQARADGAREIVRTGALGWLKEKFVGTLFRHRAELLAVQQKAQAEIEQLERRLAQLHLPLQQRIEAYEKRIAELEARLASKGEENRRLLGASISLTRQHLQVQRRRIDSN